MLIDGGGILDFSNTKPDLKKINKYTPGLKIIPPKLKRENIKKVDYLILSHPDPDHLLGLLPIIQNFEIGEVWHAGFDNSNIFMRGLLNLCESKNIKIINPPKDIKINQAQILFLGPEKFNKKFSPNDNSLILKIIYQNKSILLPGDIEKKGEKNMLTYGKKHEIDLKSDIVKAPHHGSKTSSTQDFIDATQPGHIIYMTGRHNRYGFPHLPVKKRWADSGAKPYNTGRHGEINLWLQKDRIITQTHLD